MSHVTVLQNRLKSLLRVNGGESNIIFFVKQLLLFGYLQAISCIFPVIIFVSLAFSAVVDLPVSRYDFLFVLLILIQVILYVAKIETRDELLVISMFHLLGILLEWFKVYHGSWAYPEEGYTKIYGVPLYAGFMYASVGSYICQAWRNLHLSVSHWPRAFTAALCAMLIYGNFFANAFISDMRIYIGLALVLIFWKSRFSFILNGYTYSISALLSFFIIGSFIWLAENMATFFGAWQYAYQHKGWQVVSWHKITSWSLLVIVSIIIVAELKRIKERSFIKTGMLSHRRTRDH